MTATARIIAGDKAIFVQERLSASQVEGRAAVQPGQAYDLKLDGGNAFIIAEATPTQTGFTSGDAPYTPSAEQTKVTDPNAPNTKQSAIPSRK